MSSHIFLSQNFEQKLTIGDLANAVENKVGVRCTPAMILNYERLGLLPTAERSKGGFRLFSPDAVGRLIQIKTWQEEDLTLTEIKHRLETMEEKMEMDPGELPMDRREKILDAASTIFLEFGYSATTIQAIAQEAGVSTSTIYQYFLGKEDLFQALIQRISFIDILQDMKCTLEPQGAAELEEQSRLIMIKLANAFLDSHHKNAELVRLILSEAQRFPELGIRYTQDLILPIEKSVEECFYQYLPDKVINKDWLRISIHAFFGMLLNFVLVEDLLHGKEILEVSDEDLSYYLVSLFLFGFLNPHIDFPEKQRSYPRKRIGTKNKLP